MFKMFTSFVEFCLFTVLAACIDSFKCFFISFSLHCDYYVKFIEGNLKQELINNMNELCFSAHN